MSIIKRLENFIFESPFWLFFLSLFLLTFLKVGFWYIPNLDLFYQISLDPFKNPFPDPNSHYLIFTWLSPFIGWMLGISTWFKFFLLHLFFAIAFSLIYALSVNIKFHGDQRRISLICLTILPVSGSIYYWIGPDALTILLMLLIFCFSRKISIYFLLSVLLGLQHFEQGFISMASLLLGAAINNRFAVKNNFPTRFYVLTLLGIILGKMIQTFLFSHFGLNLNSGRIFWLQQHYSVLTGQFVFNFQYILWSMIGLGWVLVIHYIGTVKNYQGFLISFLVLQFLAPVVQDQTRVLSIIMFPIFLNYFLFNYDFLRTVSRLQCSVVFFFWLLIPWGWVFSGKVQVSVLPYTTINLLNKFLGWFSVPAYRDYWPFY